MERAAKVVRWIGKLFRLWPAWVLTIGLMYAVYIFAPQQVPVALFKVMNLTLGIIIGFWASVWGEGHIDILPAKEQEGARNRRALLMAAGMVALALAA